MQNIAKTGIEKQKKLVQDVAKKNNIWVHKLEPLRYKTLKLT